MGEEEVQPHAVGVEIVTKDVAALFKCPFCGDARVRLEQNAYDAWYVHCTNCGAGGPISPVCNRNFAVDSWNRRTVDVDELELMVERFETLAKVSNVQLMDISVFAAKIRKAIGE